VAVVNVGAATSVVGRVYELKTELETSHSVRKAPPAPVQAVVGTDAFVAYRLNRYGGPLVVAHQVTGLVTVAPVGYVPAVPPVQPVNDVAVFPVHATVPDEPNEIVFAPELNLSVAAAGIVAAGKVTAAPSVVVGEEEQYDGSVTVTDDAEL
jgi:hypothetical protein